MAESAPAYQVAQWSGHPLYICDVPFCGYNTTDVATIEAHLAAGAHAGGVTAPTLAPLAESSPATDPPAPAARAEEG